MKAFLSPVALGAMLLSLYACAEQSPKADVKALDQVTLTGQTLSLHNQDQRCALLKTDGTVFSLDIPWPCTFSVDGKGLPRVETFENAQIVIAHHSPEEPAPSTHCASQYQAVRLINGQLERSVVGRMASCMRGSIDQKNFVGLFDW